MSGASATVRQIGAPIGRSPQRARWLSTDARTRRPRVGKTLPISQEFLAAALTLLLYTVGDAIDEAVFETGPEGARETRERYKKKYQHELEQATRSLGIGAGVYSVALKLAAAGEKQRAKLAIHIPNEVAKCLRALILPLIAAAVVCFVQRLLFFALSSVAAVLVLLFWYPWLKVRHIRRRYVTAAVLSQNKRYHDEQLGTVRLVFWDGNFVGSGPNVRKSEPQAVSQEGPEAMFHGA